MTTKESRPTEQVGHVVLAWPPMQTLPFLATDELFELESDAEREVAALRAGEGLFREGSRFVVAEVRILSDTFDEPSA